MPKDGKVVVSGVNVARPPPQADARRNPQGGIERTEAPMHVSKVAIDDPKTASRRASASRRATARRSASPSSPGRLING